MSAIRINGDLVHYEVLGRGRPVILLHSWVGSWRYWIPTMQQLQLKYRVYALDLFGYGDSAKNTKYTLEHQVALLENFIEHLGIGKCALIGHGLGALVSTEYAYRHQAERVPRMLITSAPLFDPGDIAQRLKVMPRVKERPARVPSPAGDSQPDATIMSRSTVFRAALQAELARTRGHGEVDTGGGMQDSGQNPLREYIAQPSLDALLGRCFRRTEPEYEKLQVDVARTAEEAVSHSISTYDSGRMLYMMRMLDMPIVVVHGAEDQIIPLPNEDVWNYLTTEKEDTLLPVPLDGVRHFPMLEYERFSRLVTDFLDSPDVSKLEIKERWRRRTR
jgi:pimeloyl-ACP methyl ester carboxylesterase